MERSKIPYVAGSVLFILGFSYLGVINSDMYKNVKKHNPNVPNSAPNLSTIPDMSQPTESCVTLPPEGTMYSTVNKLKDKFRLSQDQSITITIETNWGPITFEATTNDWMGVGLQQPLPEDVPEGLSIFQLAQPGSQSCVE